MKLLKIGMLIAGALGANVATVSAIEYVDVNNYAGNGAYISTFSPFTDSFNITPAFNPATQDVVSAFAQFYFNDDPQEGDPSFRGIPYNREWVIVDLGSFDLFGDLGTIEVNFGSTLSGGFNSGSIIASLQDGDLSFTVRSLGDLYLTSAILTVQATNPPSTNVPDSGSTVALLGVAILGFVGIRRKLLT